MNYTNFLGEVSLTEIIFYPEENSENLKFLYSVPGKIRKTSFSYNHGGEKKGRERV